MDNIPPTMPLFEAEKRHSKIMNLLSRIASDTTNNSFVGNARLASCVVYKNDIVAFGVNCEKSHPFQAKFGKNKDSVYLHAETLAIKNALRELNTQELSKASLYVCRVKYDGPSRTKMIFGLSKPCSGCERCIATFGIKKVYYTLDNQHYSML